MASLNKLAIRGIRSFDDKQISVIEFFSPVTVIVGHNGSGKTTIIECLKYATTGDQPPNTRGGAFVHDPKMANEKEVKAQVKLRFHAANGTRMLAVRNLSVTVKKTALSMKTLENILALADGNVDKGGKRGVISTKCAEIDAEIPHLLGVSKAVLENVIFCHQEDSYWPLSEPAALKKKFDDIFEATRYTKALKSIQELRKERVSDLKAEKVHLQSLANEKGHSDKLKKRLDDFNRSISEKEAECEESKRDYDAMVESNRKFYELYNRFREMYVKVEELERSKQDTLGTVKEVKAKLREIPGTLSDLENRVERFHETISKQKDQKGTEQQKLDDLSEELEEETHKQRKLVEDEARLKAEAAEQETRIRNREQVIQEISDAYGIQGMNVALSERDRISDFLQRLDTLQRNRRDEFEKLRTELHSQTEDYQSKLRVLDKDVERLKLQKQGIRDQINDRQQKIKGAGDTAEGVESVNLSISTLGVEVQEKKERLQKLRSAISLAKYDTRIADFTKTARGLEEQREELNTELQSLTLQADTRARLDLKRAEVKSKSVEIHNNMELLNKKFKALAGRTIQAEKAEDEVERIYLEKEREQGKLQNDSKTASGRLQKADADLNNLTSQLKSKKVELKGKYAILLLFPELDNISTLQAWKTG
ncbi:AAA domain-containing protein [Crepidotus variabilis]|uniref:DNA repair protein RAD50 n=1 Tax=Crepidotus variabilis TaxID=179855 RepID=A0A9P6JTH0_9AGAR|nr:AAA domain-containing protein [Crepidotus variabilis]